MNNSNIKVRKAISSDYDSILDINRDVYEGFDYLPASFHTLLHNPDVRMFVTECEGQIVQFVGIWFTGDKREALVFGARVHNDFQGRGLMAKSMEYIHKYIQHNYRHPVNAVSAAYFDAKIHPPSGILKDQTRIHRTWNILKYGQNANKLRTTETDKKQNVHRFSLDTTLSLLKQSKTLQMLQRDGDYIIYTPLWVPLKITEDNLRPMAKTSTVCQFSIDNGEATAVSFGDELLYKNNTMRCDLFYYGGSGNVDIWMSHVVHYLSNLKASSLSVQRYLIALHFPTDIDVKEAEETLRSVLGETYIRDNNKYKSVVMLRDKKPINATAKL